MCDKSVAQRLFTYLGAGEYDEAHTLAEAQFVGMSPDLYDAEAQSIVWNLYNKGCEQSRATLFMFGVLRNVKQRTQVLETAA